MSIVGTGLTALSVLGGAFGMKKSAEANREYDSFLKTKERKLSDWFNKEYNQNYLDTTESQAVLSNLRERMKKQSDTAANTAAVTGASDEAVTAQKAGMNSAMAEVTNNIAGAGTQRRDGIRREFMDRSSVLDQLKGQNLQAKASNWGNMQGNALNLATTAATAGADGAFKEWDNKIGSWFKSSSTPKL